MLCGHYLDVIATSPDDHTSPFRAHDEVGGMAEGETGSPRSALHPRRDVGAGSGGEGDEEVASVIRVYLKQGFVLDGLLGILRSRGEAVFLRDVGHHQTEG